VFTTFHKSSRVHGKEKEISGILTHLVAYFATVVVALSAASYKPNKFKVVAERGVQGKGRTTNITSQGFRPAFSIVASEN